MGLGKRWWHMGAGEEVAAWGEEKVFCYAPNRLEVEIKSLRDQLATAPKQQHLDR